MKNQHKKILFLYTELAGYFIACVEQLASHPDVEIHIMHYPLNPVAPFKFKFDSKIKYYERKNFDSSSLEELVDKINPDYVYTCGWMDKDYVRVSKLLKKRIPVILTSDNPWRGTIKQQIASLIGPYYLPKIFTHLWVPGEPNAVYGRKLGFRGKRLLTGMYSADYDLFHQNYIQNRESKKENFPKRFIYVGRYAELKGTRELWKAFLQLQEEQPNEWELWCLGKGDLESEMPAHPKIINCGFVQPTDLGKYIAQTGVFILPTHYEHWGVVVHEFAAAGFPMICSTTTSAATAFLQEGTNGFYTQPKNVQSIVEAMKKIINQTDQALFEMGERSVELSKLITPETWSNTLLSTINE